MTRQPVQTKKVIIVGAAGRDFHDFNVFWNDDAYEVVAFTATQIPGIDSRRYPPALAGRRYPDGIPIEPQEKLAELIQSHGVDQVAMAYSDLPFSAVMDIASIANAAGADFRLLAPHHTMLEAHKPVISVCAVRTGCGKSQTVRAIASMLRADGLRVAAIRHPMPYGDLEKQACQRFGSYEDLDAHDCTIEEREEYEPHIRNETIVYAGVDYEKILRQAEQECDIILWDGGNNDLPFIKPDLHVVVADAHRSGDELAYYPGETNARLADLFIINKVDSADPRDVSRVETNLRRLNPKAKIIKASSPVTADHAASIYGKRVLVIEDGPTLTHGDMTFGAGAVAAQKHGADTLVDPRPFAVGSIKETFAKYTHLTNVLPAMGYGAKQREELEETINAANCDIVIVGTPINLAAVIDVNKPMLRVQYDLDADSATALRDHVVTLLEHESV